MGETTMSRYRRASRACALGLVHALIVLPIFASMEFSSGAPAAFAQGGGGGTSGGGGGSGPGSGGGSGSGSGSGSSGSGGSGGTASSVSSGGTGISGASGAGASAPGPSGISSADGLSPDISVAGATGGIADFWAPRRLIQTAEKAATDAAHYATLATKAAEQTSVAEASDRPAHLAAASTPATLVTASANPFQRFRRGMQAQTSFGRGRSLLEERKYVEAREQLAEATALAPDHDEARALLGWAQYFAGESREAIVTFKSALRRQPTWEGLYNGLGWSRLRLARYHLASVAFRQALDRNPDYVDAVNGMGSALFALGQYEAALPLLDKALRGTRTLIGPDPPETTSLRNKVAWTLYYVGRYREALAMFIRVNLAAPSSHQSLVGMGWCYMQLGQKGDARAAFQRALQLRPTDEDAREGFRRAGS